MTTLPLGPDREVLRLRHALRSHDKEAAHAVGLAGLDGVRYVLRNDPAATMVGIALFGPAGEQGLPVLMTSPVDEATLASAAHRYGVEALPTP